MSGFLITELTLSFYREQRYNDSVLHERHGAFTATFSENLQTSLTPPSQA
jgi:hypothetical protein